MLAHRSFVGGLGENEDVSKNVASLELGGILLKEGPVNFVLVLSPAAPKAHFVNFLFVFSPV